LETDEVTARIERDGAEVLYVQAPSPEVANQLLGALG